MIPDTGANENKILFVILCMYSADSISIALMYHVPLMLCHVDPFLLVDRSPILSMYETEYFPFHFVFSKFWPPYSPFCDSVRKKIGVTGPGSNDKSAGISYVYITVLQCGQKTLHTPRPCHPMVEEAWLLWRACVIFRPHCNTGSVHEVRNINKIELVNFTSVCAF